MRKRTRLLAVICALTVVVSMAGCGKKDADSSGSGKKGDKGNTGDSVETIISEIDNYVYKAEPVELGETTDLSRCKVIGDNIYALYMRYDYNEGEEAIDGEIPPVDIVTAEGESDADQGDISEYEGEYGEINSSGSYNIRIVCYGMDGTKKSEYERETEESDGYINDFTADKNGNLYAMSEKYTVNDVTGIGSSEFMIECIDPNSGVKWSKPVVSDIQNQEDYFYPSGIKAVDDKLILNTNMGIDIYDLNGEKIKRVGDQNSDLDWGSALLLRDNTVAVMSYMSENPEMYSYDLETGKKGDKIEIPVNLWAYSVSAGNLHDFILSNSTGLYYFNIGDKEAHKFIDYVASDLCCYNIYSISEIDDDTFYGSYYDELRGDGGEQVTSKFTKVEPEKSASKTTLTIGGSYVGSDIRKNIILFNRGSDKYRIVIKDYSSYGDSNEYNESLTLMNNDIIAGTMPDIMILNSSMNIENYLVKGAFEPLDQYMEKDGSFNRSDYMENVLDAFTYDGKLYCVTPNFSVSTLVGKKSVVGDSKKSFDELSRIAESIGPETKVFQDMTKESFVRNMLYYDLEEFVDFSKGEVHFDSDAFVKVLEFTDGLPKEINYDDDDWEYSEAAYRENRALVQMLTMYDFRDSVSYYKYVMFGDEIGFIGFPSSVGSGHAIGFDTAFAISASSKYKEGAWEFVKTYISDEIQDNMTWGFPIKKAALEKMGRESMKPRTYTDENGKEQVINDTYWLDGKEIEAQPPTQADIDYMINLLGSADKLVNYNDSISNIVIEEAQSYFEGQKSAADTAKVIQSRIQIYVNENR